MKNILVFFGGASPEHEVSVITGLQIFEHIDRKKYNPIPIYVSENNVFYKLQPIKSRKDYSLKNKLEIFFGYDEKSKSPYFFSENSNRENIHCVINTLHGGGGESGLMAGLFESYNIPYSSTGVESSVICMNKFITKKTVSLNNIPTIDSLSFLSDHIRKSVKEIATEIISKISLPVIIKPVHLGSSIGIKIAKEKIDLELYLLEASHIDTEVMVEKYLENISEFNCSIRTVNKEVVTSEIERPLNKAEILSFSDKYEKGGKKTTGGMASLSRELPANIPPELEKKIKDYSLRIYKSCKCKGVVRIDFILSNKGDIYFNEINPIPGSMAFYLWEVMGIPFKQQISELIEESVNVQLESNLSFVHKTSIIENFVKNYKF